MLLSVFLIKITQDNSATGGSRDPSAVMQA